MASDVRKSLDKAAEGSEIDVQGSTPKSVVTRWMRELDASDRHEKDWRDRAEKIVHLYKDERKKGEQSADSTERRFNILYANTEVLKGALYQRCPIPDIRRRWLDRDPVGRLAALILNRCVATTIDQGDLDGMLELCVQDMVLPGRGMAQVRYKPTINSYEERVAVDAPAEGAVTPEDVEQDESGHFRMEKVEEVAYECVELEYSDWSMVRFSPAKRWKKLRWIAFGELLTRDDLVREFGELGNKVELKWAPPEMEEKEENQILKRALVWTIWNKTQRRVIVVSDGYTEAPLKDIEDPLRLQDFFPAPKALYSIFTNDSMVPTPEYAVYQDHARELDALEERISILQQALRRRGVFDAQFPELAELAKTGDNKFVGIKNYREFVEKGGLDMALQEQDLSTLAQVLGELLKLAEVKKQTIYELIGISDIMRGIVNPNEKLGQSQLKSQYGSVRSGPRQKAVQRFARDVIRLTAEVIAEHFSPQTLQAMSGIQLALNEQEKVQLSQTAPDDPRGKRPTWDDVLKVLRSDKLRGFKVGIETDSTIKPAAEQEQKNRVELLTAITGYLQQMVPAVQSGQVPKKVASELLIFGVRAFPAGSQLEELLDEWASGGIDEMLAGGQAGQQQQGQQQSPEQAQQAVETQEAAKASAHADQLRAIEVQKANAELAKSRAQAYAEITKAEALVPGMQLDSLMQEANLKRAQAQASAAALPAPGALQ